MRLGAHFILNEFRCRCHDLGGKAYPDCQVLPSLSPQFISFVAALDRLRGKWGHPLIITAGGRCTRHNADVGGVAHSLHLFDLGALAVDILIKDPTEYHDLLLMAEGDDYFKEHGIGIYHDGHIHLDAGEQRTWTK
jgi:uncharacterized protein YcbK (DUF882 family)